MEPCFTTSSSTRDEPRTSTCVRRFDCDDISRLSLFSHRNVSLYIVVVQDSGIAKAVIGRESSNEKFARESFEIIAGYGDLLYEVICRDACDGLNISRVGGYAMTVTSFPVGCLLSRVPALLQMLALSSLDSLLSASTCSSSLLVFIVSHGYMKHLLNTLVWMSVSLALTRVTCRCFHLY